MTSEEHIVGLLRILQKDLSGDGEHYQASIVQRAADALQSLTARVAGMEEALKKIERWHGEFPSTGMVWPGSGEPMSYGAAFGSNGERDYMREIARKALNPVEAK